MQARLSSDCMLTNIRGLHGSSTRPDERWPSPAGTTPRGTQRTGAESPRWRALVPSLCEGQATTVRNTCWELDISLTLHGTEVGMLLRPPANVVEQAFAQRTSQYSIALLPVYICVGLCQNSVATAVADLGHSGQQPRTRVLAPPDMARFADWFIRRSSSVHACTQRVASVSLVGRVSA